jgi:O-methyltransferase involved in polyketide biosynthesis
MEPATGKINIDLANVQKTLLLPLWGRAAETRKKNPMLVDTAAVDIIDRIDYDFSTIANSMSPITQLAWVVRCLHIDRTIKRFLQTHPKATVVNIGCGLDTTFQRLDNGSLAWYDLDLPDVIALRKRLIPEADRCHCIASSFFDDSWPGRLKIDNGLFFIAAGVLYYFEETEIRDFFLKLARAFPGGEFIFDAASPLGVRVANKKVIAAGGMDEHSILKWGVRSIGDIAHWDDRITILDHYPMFRHMKRAMSIKNTYGTFWSDLLKIMSMVHVRFSDEANSFRESRS